VLAGISSSTAKLIESNLLGTVNLLEWASKNNSSVIFLSTSRVYPIEKLNQIQFEETDTRLVVAKSQNLNGISSKGISEDFPLKGSRSFYGSAKLCSELLIEEYHQLKELNAIVLRCGVIAGPGQFGKVDQGIFVHWLASHYWKRELRYVGYGGQGKQVRDFLHVDDISDLACYLTSNFDQANGMIMNVGGGHSNSLSLHELTELCGSVTGNKLAIKSEIATRVADIPYYISDNSLLESALQWKPKNNLTKLLGDTFDWLKKNESVLKEII
jgi:CDP-paratose 2-epimerase